MVVRLNFLPMSLKKIFADFLFPLVLGLLVVSCASPGRGPGGARHDVVIQNGTIYDGSGGVPFVGTVAIRGDRISYLGAPTELRVRALGDPRRLLVAVADGRQEGLERRGDSLVRSWREAPLWAA